ncbi:MAG: L-threonylcarbamoyladenylate synthase [Bauldia sp.]|nr:L-threonylcarbamoyladenylate synthase [Bauldia sp.]
MADPAQAERGIAAAVAALDAGALVAMPTETVYGLAADATSPRAVAGIFEAKGRPRFNPLIVHVADIAAARRYVQLGAAGENLAGAFWPGPLTLVARPSSAPVNAAAAGDPDRGPSPAGSSGIADLVQAGLSTLAIRVPRHPVAEALLRAFGRPLAAPSANRSGHVSATTATHVAADLGDRVAIILDAGPAPMGVESTIVDVSGEDAVLLRPGAVTREAIEAVLGRALATPLSAAVLAPGMMASHYAPVVPVRLDAASVRPGESLLAFGAALPPGAEHAVATVNLSSSGDIREAAANLFAALRTLEARGAPIAAMPIPPGGLGEAITDRLRRAAAPR